jgi:hypothetical protein
MKKIVGQRSLNIKQNFHPWSYKNSNKVKCKIFKEGQGHICH